MSYPKLIQMVNRIGEATELGLVSWKDTEEQDVYQLSFANYSVRIGERSSRLISNQKEYYLAVFDVEGDVIESIGDEDGDGNDERAHLFRTMKNTFEIARRQAKGVDQAIDSILFDLNDRLPF